MKQNNDIQIIKKTTLLGKEVDVYGTIENPLFKAKDVAEWIEYDTSSLNKFVSLVDDDEDKVRKNVPTLGGMQEVWMLTEDGLYEILMQSRKPIAKQFKKGVKRILHEIRTNGGYMTAIADETPEQTMARAILIAQATMKRQREQLEQQQKLIEEQKPKVKLADTITATAESIPVNMLAKFMAQKGYNVGEHRLFKYLRENGYIGRRGNHANVPCQRYIDMGLFEIQESTDGQHTSIVPMVTGKGQLYFINKFTEDKIPIERAKIWVPKNKKFGAYNCQPPTS